MSVKLCEFVARSKVTTVNPGLRLCGRLCPSANGAVIVRSQMPPESTMRDVGFAYVSETEMRCTACRALVPATFAGALAHNERTLRHAGVAISPCDGRRIAADGA